MDSKDKKEIAQLIGDVIDQKVTPKLVKLESGQTRLESGQKKLESQNKTIIEQVVQNSEDITIMQENVREVSLTEERIETLVEASIRRQDSFSIKSDQLSRRMLHLESKKA